MAKKIVWSDSGVRCPFYISNDKEARTITCEGYEDGMFLLTRFPNYEKKYKFMGRKCCANYEKCPLYEMVYNTKYKEGNAYDM